jgi:hypothetical protein
MKRGILIFALFSILIIQIINLASAQFFIDQLLNTLDTRTVIFFALFLIFFTLINFSLLRVFRGNKAVSATIALAVSFLIVYGIFRSGYSIEDIFFNIGIDEASIFNFFVIASVVLLIWIIFRYGAVNFFLVLGVILIFVSYTTLVYERASLRFIGFAIAIIALWFLFRQRQGLVGAPAVPGAGIVGGAARWAGRRATGAYQGRAQARYAFRQQRMQQRLAERQRAWELKQRQQYAQTRYKGLIKRPGFSSIFRKNKP